MPAAQKGKDDVIQHLAGVFRRHGYDGATLTMLSDATGLVKASLYHYFPNGKQDMARAVLDYLGELSKSEVLDKIDYAGDPRRELNALCERLVHYFQQGQVSCILEVFTLGQAKGLFQDTIAARMSRIAEAYARLLQRAGIAESVAQQRGWEALVTIEGALVVTRATGDTKLFRNMMMALPTRILK
ncbi:MAG: TetR/AcrR family transcriptional regulator [Gammaproteobacteria bacterium]|nr:TetR/AcrR family transcriptional regulator [Gammaproteobacteria bacterium]